MNREKAISELKKLQNFNDIEANHSEADDILCDLLASLGFEDVVKEYEEIYKWYA